MSFLLHFGKKNFSHRNFYFLFAGLQSLWTTAICSSNLQHKHPPLNPPTTSQSSDQLLQIETPISDKGKREQSEMKESDSRPRIDAARKH